MFWAAFKIQAQHNWSLLFRTTSVSWSRELQRWKWFPFTRPLPSKTGKVIIIIYPVGSVFLILIDSDYSEDNWNNDNGKDEDIDNDNDNDIDNSNNKRM